jgi:hypothetical protein
MMRVLTLALFLSACATTQVPSRDRLHVDLRTRNQARQLKASVLVTPFFRDASRRLLLSQPSDETELMVTPRNEPISPGKVLEVLPAGTKVRVLAVRFATGWESFTRPLMTPRERTWVELAVDGRSADVAYTFTLRPDVANEDEVIAELEKWITETDVAAEVAALPEADKQVVAKREFVAGVKKRTLELAFGTPLTKKIKGDGTSVSEEWDWRSDAGVHRIAWIADDVATKYETIVPEKKKAATP